MFQHKISVGIVAHVDAGKTTLTEQLLYKTGTIAQAGRVDKRDTVTDFMSVERERGITVNAVTVGFQWQETQFYLLDTPGHMDFIAEVERSLSALDVAVLAISAKEGVQAQTRVLFSALRRLKIPTLLFVNKVDRTGVAMERVYEQIETYLTEVFVPLQKVGGEGTRDITLAPRTGDERLAYVSDRYMAAYLKGDAEPTCFQEVLKEAFNKGECFPVLHGSALHGIGIEPLLEALVTLCAPERGTMLSATCYKVDRDEKGLRRCYVKIEGGTLVLRETYPVVGTERHFKILKMAALKGAKPVIVTAAYAGDIVLIYTGEIGIGDRLGIEASEPKVEVSLGTPTLVTTLAPAEASERRALLEALTVLADEDPFVRFEINPRTEAIGVQLFGEVQQEILERTLKERFQLSVVAELPKTLFKQTPTEAASATCYMCKDTHYAATIGFEVLPLPTGSGIQYETQVSYGDLKQSFQTAVRDGVMRRAEEGVDAWPLTDMKVCFVYSEYDSVMSTPSAFRHLASEVLEKALKDVSLTRLEPYLAYTAYVPRSAVGKVASEVLKSRGTVAPPQFVGENATITGVIPVETSRTFALEMAAYTGGEGVFQTEFSGYRPYGVSL